MKKFIFTTVLLLFWANWANANSLAMITDMKQGVLLNGQPAELFAEVAASAQLKLDKNASITLVYLDSGKEYMIKGPALIMLGAKGPMQNNRLLVASNQLRQNAKLDDTVSSFSQAAIVMRATDNEENPLQILSPISGKLLETHPLFSWNNVGGGYQYRLEIFDADGNSLFVTKTRQTRFRLPKSITLPVGVVLNWELEATKGMDAYFNSGEFSIADSKTIARINLLRPKSDNFSHLAFFARALDKHGYHQEAQQYWHKLAKMRPNEPLVQNKLR